VGDALLLVVLVVLGVLDVVVEGVGELDGGAVVVVSVELAVELVGAETGG
jgi:hypothetical protein